MGFEFDVRTCDPCYKQLQTVERPSLASFNDAKLKRDSGQYWPSICQYMPSGCTAIEYVPESRHLYVGQENGTVTQYALSEDCNRLSFLRDYLSHQARVVAVVFSRTHKWVLSAGKDKQFAYHCTESGKRVGGYNFETPCTALQ